MITTILILTAFNTVTTILFIAIAIVKHGKGDEE